MLCPRERRGGNSVVEISKCRRGRNIILTLRRGDYVRLDPFHPPTLLLGVGTAAYVRLLDLRRLLEVGIHLRKDVLGGILYILEDGLKLPRVLLVSHRALPRHGVNDLDRGRVVVVLIGGLLDAVVVVDACVVVSPTAAAASALNRVVELSMVRREVLVARCHADAALRGAIVDVVVATAIALADELVVVVAHWGLRCGGIKRIGQKKTKKHGCRALRTTRVALWYP